MPTYSYWEEQERRLLKTEPRILADILFYSLLGFYYEAKELYGFEGTLYGWLCTKRPLGSKAFHASVLYRLNLDPEQRLCTEDVPARLRELAEELWGNVEAKVLSWSLGCIHAGGED